MNSLFHELEMPLSRILADMEKQGIKANTADLQALGSEFEEQISRLMAEIYKLSGTEFNLNSPKQLGEILFDRLGLPVVKKTKTGYSTDAEVLEKLAPYNDVVKHILQYRQLAKLQSTYVEGLLKEISNRDGKVHTYYRQTIAATGRLSSQFPKPERPLTRVKQRRVDRVPHDAVAGPRLDEREPAPQVLADRADERGAPERGARQEPVEPCTSPRWKAVKCSETTTGTPSRRPSSTAGKPASNTWAWMTSGRHPVRRHAAGPPPCRRAASPSRPARSRGRR